MRPLYLSQSYSRATRPRRGLADPTWVYRSSVATDVAETIENERRRLALVPREPQIEPVPFAASRAEPIAAMHDDCADIARYTGTSGRIRGWLLAVAIGLGLALAPVHWWTT